MRANSKRASLRTGQCLGRFRDRCARLRRSPNGKVLGVLSGIADYRGYSVFWTRVVGCIVLLFLSGGSLLAGAFFYLLAAVLMRGPEIGFRRLDRGTSLPGWASCPSAEMPYYRGPGAARVDFLALDRELDGLSRHIEHMEMTDHFQSHWNRRMES